MGHSSWHKALGITWFEMNTVTFIAIVFGISISYAGMLARVLEDSMTERGPNASSFSFYPMTSDRDRHCAIVDRKSKSILLPGHGVGRG